MPGTKTLIVHNEQDLLDDIQFINSDFSNYVLQFGHPGAPVTVSLDQNLALIDPDVDQVISYQTVDLGFPQGTTVVATTIDVPGTLTIIGNGSTIIGNGHSGLVTEASTATLSGGLIQQGIVNQTPSISGGTLQVLGTIMLSAKTTQDLINDLQFIDTHLGNYILQLGSAGAPVDFTLNQDLPTAWSWPTWD